MTSWMKRRNLICTVLFSSLIPLGGKKSGVSLFRVFLFFSGREEVGTVGKKDSGSLSLYVFLCGGSIKMSAIVAGRAVEGSRIPEIRGGIFV